MIQDTITFEQLMQELSGQTASLSSMKPAPLEKEISAFELAHLGAITASQAHRISRDSKGWGAAAISLALEVFQEHETGKPYQDFEGNAFTAFGKKHEPEALAAFFRKMSVQKIKVIHEQKFFPKPGSTLCGATPEAIIEFYERGKWIRANVEAKCPPRKHARFLTAETLPKDYLKQVLFQQQCTGINRTFFVSFNPEFRYNPLKIIHFVPDPHEAAEFADTVSDFEQFVLGILADNKTPILPKFETS